MTTHHLIFKDSETRRELWISYPIISNVCRRQSSNVLTPAPTAHQLQQVNPHSGVASQSPISAAASQQNPYTNALESQKSPSNDQNMDMTYFLSKPSIRIKCKDFVFIALTFTSDQVARDTYDTLMRLTCIHDIRQLYAYFYKPLSVEKNFNGWTFYDTVAEFTRQGALGNGANWRITNINSDYQLSPTYPAVFLVPSAVSDSVLNYAAKFRSKARIPALSYYHMLNGCTITRCSQPMVGLKQARSAQDEKIAAEILTSNQSKVHLNNNSEFPQKLPGITIKQDNLIVDARPTANAMAQTALGAGSENMENYKGARKVYLGIDNIHVMRDSLQRVVDALKDGDISCTPPLKEALHRSNWLRYISTILEGAITVAEHVHFKFSHVIVHCSDGWDRTSQISSIAQIILDPYYRTLEGFIVLVEKEWLSFGHRFSERSGHLNSEKNFTEPSDSPFGGAHQIFKDVGSKFVKSGSSAVAALGGGNRQNNNSNKKGLNSSSAMDSTSGYNGSSSSFFGGPGASSSAFGSGYSSSGSNMKYTAPIFHQFLDAVYQLVVQFPDRFEFGERFLRRLLYHTYSCQYGTFLFNSELERKEARAHETTRSVWDYFLSRKNEFINLSKKQTNENTASGNIDSTDSKDKRNSTEEIAGYDREREFGYPADKIVLYPNTKQLKYWAELFGRSSEEMNTRPKTAEPILKQTSSGENELLPNNALLTKPKNSLDSLEKPIAVQGSPLIKAESEKPNLPKTTKDTCDNLAPKDSTLTKTKRNENYDPLSNQLVNTVAADSSNLSLHSPKQKIMFKSKPTSGVSEFPVARFSSSTKTTSLVSTSSPVLKPQQDGKESSDPVFIEGKIEEVLSSKLDDKTKLETQKEDDSNEIEQPLDPKLYARFNTMTTLDFEDGDGPKKNETGSKFSKFGLF